jgi:hypothetical protein
VGCVNTFEPHLGTLVRTVDLSDQTVSYGAEFDHQAINDFTAKRLAGVYKDGCFARELSAEQNLVSRVPAPRRLPIISTTG